MNNLNWRTRIKNKYFWLAFVSALLIVVQAVAAPFGYTIDIEYIGVHLTAVVNAVFGVLTVIGIVNDPNTFGIGDSSRVMGYDEPAKE